MDRTKILLISQIVACALLVVSVLLQNRAEGLGKMFGGGGEICPNPSALFCKRTLTTNKAQATI